MHLNWYSKSKQNSKRAKTSNFNTGKHKHIGMKRKSKVGDERLSQLLRHWRQNRNAQCDER